MVLVSWQGKKARVTSLVFGWAVRVARSRTGESGRVNDRRTMCARRRDSAVSPEPLGGGGWGGATTARAGRRTWLPSLGGRPIAREFGDGRWRVHTLLRKMHPRVFSRYTQEAAHKLVRLRRFCADCPATENSKIRLPPQNSNIVSLGEHLFCVSLRMSMREEKEVLVFGPSWVPVFSS